MVYDTLYAHQDKADDRSVGLQSTALTFGDDGTKPILTAAAAASVALLGCAGTATAAGWPFYAGVGGAAVHMMWQIHTAQLDDRLNLTERFVSNFWVSAVRGDASHAALARP